MFSVLLYGYGLRFRHGVHGILAHYHTDIPSPKLKDKSTYSNHHPKCYVLTSQLTLNKFQFFLTKLPFI